ncbi:MAG: hypothetical protein AVDCRST_MAG67-1973, partial [uncultured Solirubrobacteraceae bacterium]
ALRRSGRKVVRGRGAPHRAGHLGGGLPAGRRAVHDGRPRRRPPGQAPGRRPRAAATRRLRRAERVRRSRAATRSPPASARDQV